MNKRIVYGLIALLVVIGAVYVGGQYLYENNQNNTSQQADPTPTPTPTPAETEQSEPQEVVYQGEEGKTALELLQQNADVEMSGEGEMAFVTSINGYTAKSDEFWSFLVNGQMAEVGAGTYVTTNNDEITWKIEKITPQ